MKSKTGSWLLIFFLVGSIFSGMFISIPNNNVAVAAINPSGIFLIDEPEDYIVAGFNPAGLPVYTKDSLIDFYMPIALKKEDVQNLIDSDVEHTILHGNTIFDDRLNYIEFEILESSTYWVVLYHMNVKASDQGFSIDFVPKIKGEELGQFAWWNSSWVFLKQITIDSSQVPSTLTNFPILVNITDTDLRDDAQDDGDDIAFVLIDDTTQLNHEIESFDGATGQLVAWINITSLPHDSDLVFNMYYNNSEASNQQNVSGTWDSDYVMVQHMTGASATDLDDSTANNNDVTSDGGDPDYNFEGLVGDAVYFDGDDYVIVGSPTNLPTGSASRTISIWGKPSEQGFGISYGIAAENRRCDLTAGAGDTWWFQGQGAGDMDSGVAVAYNSWTCFAASYNSTTVETYVNDTVGNSGDRSLDTGSSDIYIGDYLGGSNGFNGIIDEVRLSKVVRSADWILTSYNTINNATVPGFIKSVGSETFESDINPVTNFTATATSSSSIFLNWTQSVNANYTILERNSISSWDRGSGTEIYNDTSNNYTDSDLTISTIYYYRAWAYNESIGNYSFAESTNNHTGPLNPSDIFTTVSSTTINFTWTKGTRADNTIIVRKTDSFPSSPSDGTEIYNGSVTGYDDTSFTATSFYRLFSYNTTNNLFSSGINAEWGILQVRVYDENTSEIIYNYTVFITNQDGSETYENYSAGFQVTSIDLDNLPTGTDVVVEINATSYKDRIYIMDIYPNNFYNLSAYLPQIIDVKSYVVRVTNDYGNGVEDAKIKFQRYINETVGYEDVGIYHTDANGYLTIDLFPGEKYLLEISKSGYDTTTPFMYPIEILYIEDRYHTFKLPFLHEEPDIVTPADIIHFNGTINSSGVIQIWYDDYNSNTTNTAIYVYEYHETLLIWNHTDTRTGQNGFSFTDTGYNTSRTHKIVLHLNHSELDYQVLSFFIYPLRSVTDEADIETRFEDVFGDFELGWVKTFMIFVPCMFFLIVFGASHAGLGILTSGLYLGFSTYFLSVGDTASIGGASVYVFIASMLAIVGFLVIVIKKGSRAI